MSEVIKILVIFFSIKFAHSAIEEHYQSIFLRDGVIDYCQLKCNGKPHTLCNKTDVMAGERNVHERCVNFKAIELTDKMQLELIRGHNGLRNRYAKVVGVANMKELVWDEELAKMAFNWSKLCQPFEKDPCANLEKSKEPYTQINQNSAFIKKRYFPRYFTIEILRGWYLERRISARPHILKNEAFFPELKNFTQIGWSSTSRVGCAITFQDNGYRLVCNYYPFESLNRSAYRVGRPCSRCPRDTPLCSNYFEYLCTVGSGSKPTKSLWEIFLPIILIKLLL